MKRDWTRSKLLIVAGLMMVSFYLGRVYDGSTCICSGIGILQHTAPRHPRHETYVTELDKISSALEKLREENIKLLPRQTRDIIEAIKGIVLKKEPKQHEATTNRQAPPAPTPRPNASKQDQQLVVSNLSSHASMLCPEKYGGMYALPYCMRGYDTLNCTTNKPLTHLVTVLLNFVICSENKCGSIQEVLSSITSMQFYPQSKSNSYPRVVLATSDGVDEKAVQQQYPQLDVKLYLFKLPISAGGVWNGLIKEIKTPYVLLAPDITHFTNDSRIDRLIREAGLLQAHFVGGSVRTKAGHWFPNCLQTYMKSFRLSFKTGYEKSKHECMYCDYLNSPFLARSTTLKENLFDESLSPELVFDDFFLRAKLSKKVTVVCPDSMFHVQYLPKTRSNKETWKPFVRKWELNMLSTPDGYNFEYTCNEANLVRLCRKQKSLKSFLRPPCCIKDLADMVNTMMEVCHTHNIYCVPESGTALGAVKMSGPLLWEVDADVSYAASNYSAWKALGPVFKKLGYALVEIYDNTNSGGGGSFNLFSEHWFLDAYGYINKLVAPIQAIRRGEIPTKMMFFGKWINTETNPAFNARNCYGYEILKHHTWAGTQGKFTEWLFPPCAKPGAHYCLDQYKPDGNIELIDDLSNSWKMPQRKDDGNPN